MYFQIFGVHRIEFHERQADGHRSMRRPRGQPADLRAITSRRRDFRRFEVHVRIRVELEQQPNVRVVLEAVQSRSAEASMRCLIEFDDTF